MGKNKRKRPRAEAIPFHENQSTSLYAKDILLPRSFPSHLKRPTNDFLRNEDPYKESFRSALKTAYEGFVVDERVGQEDIVQSCLNEMYQNDYFRRDVTQPFGLGTKCAKTYVTRCLLGEQGTTYKYLGLRMFAHPWKNTEIQKLGTTLTQQTQNHLKTLTETRGKRNAPGTKGRAVFDICLINRMEAYEDLKNEPTIGTAKTSVSWHADSSLEHYSTIAVYQTLIQNTKSSPSNNVENKWFVALRVAHHSEGPQSSRRGTDIESSIIKETPPIAVSLPSGSAYYLLDDFNHHHQHTVLTNGDLTTAGIRYSCTYRLLRDSHNVYQMIHRCQAACSNFHKKGSKVWRSEQLLLTEIESEWIRQFYIQGKQHHDLLWSSWKEPIQQLLRMWSQLERRTKQTIDLLKSASEAKCGMDMGGEQSTLSGPKPSKAVRKARERRKKALVTVEDLMTRNSLDEKDAVQHIYQPFAEIIEQRSIMREQWAKREKDYVFRELEEDCRPMSIPFQFNVFDETKKSDGFGVSPMTGSPSELKLIATDLLEFGKAYQSGRLSDLPASTTNKETSNKTKEEDHAKSLQWSGWGQHDFGLELQQPWAGAVIQGRKPIETRSYDLPSALIGKRILIIQSPAGKPGVSNMGDFIEFSMSDKNSAQVIGWCIFEGVKKYTNRDDFEADEAKHLVTRDSGYGWKEGKTKVIYGWVVGQYHAFKNEVNDYISGTRRMRSLFQIRLRTSTPKPSQKRNKKKKRKRF